MFRRIVAAAALVLLIAAGLLLWYRTSAPGTSGPGTAPGTSAPGTSALSAAPTRGGTLTATMRAEPRTFNRFASAAFPTHLVSLLTDARLVRVDPSTDQPHPWLADSVTLDGTTLTIVLREGLKFSTGAPATADDVAWSLKAAYATPQGSVGDVLRIGGQEIAARVDSPTRVVLTLPSPWAPAVRLLEALPIYPRSVIEPAIAAGTFAASCPTSSPCPGLGPFVVSRYDAGERIVFARNPHYWRTGIDGQPLPYLEGLTLTVAPDQNAEVLRLAGGLADLLQTELRSEDVRTLRPDVDAGRVTLSDVGLSTDREVLWFNLGPAPIDPAKAFLREDAFRQAVSLAVDRQGFADTVFLGAAAPSSEPVSAANTSWAAPDLPRPTYDPARAASLLEGLNLKDRDNDGVREDAAGRPVRFAVLIQAGVTSVQTAMAFLRDALANIGVGLDIVALDLGAVMGQWQAGQYDAVFHYIQVSDTDPASNLDFWLSRGSNHLWHPNQKSAATAWEAEIDKRMLAMASTMDAGARRREFAEVQRLILTHNPAIWFAAPRIFVATRPRVGGVTPRVSRPQVLWAADELFVRN